MKVDIIEGTTVRFEEGVGDKPFTLTIYPRGIMLTFASEQAFLDFRDSIGHLWTEGELEDMRKHAGDSKCNPM